MLFRSILSRTDNLSEENLDSCLSLIKEHNHKATIVTTDWSKISGQLLLEAMEHCNIAKDMIEHEHDHHHSGETCSCGCKHEHHHEHHHEQFI